MNAFVLPSPPPNTKAIETNRREFGEDYARINWITPERAISAGAERAALLDAMAPRALVGCNGMKLDCRGLSPGCQVCAAGTWSCLFISGHCNCSCFFCPTNQDQPDIPTTGTVTFNQPKEYVTYLERFGFTGVGLSGGEPLMNRDVAVRFIRQIRAHFGPGYHIWLYTNGTLVTEPILRQLKEAGLNEIRFNALAALNLEAARLAAGIIDTVSVEIPAVPELEKDMKDRIVAMRDAGVRHLNLHQLRLTKYNLPKMTVRPYTFIHGDSPTVLESELTALRLLQWTLDEGIALPINYCSYVYRNRGAALAARLRGVSFVAKPHEDVTANGYIRTLTLEGEPQQAIAQAETYIANGHPEGAWRLSPRKDRLDVAAALWPLTDFSRFRAAVTYHRSRIVPALSHQFYFVEVPLTKKRSLYVEKIPEGAPVPLSATDIKALSRQEVPDTIRPYEHPQQGLAPYG